MTLQKTNSFCLCAELYSGISSMKYSLCRYCVNFNINFHNYNNKKPFNAL